MTGLVERRRGGNEVERPDQLCARTRGRSFVLQVSSCTLDQGKLDKSRQYRKAVKGWPKGGGIQKSQIWLLSEILFPTSVSGPCQKCGSGGPPGGVLIGRCRIGRQKTYCQVCGKDAASNEKKRWDTTQVISPKRLALPNREGDLLLVL